MFIYAVDELAEPLSNLFSILLKEGIWPESLSRCIFFPLIKDGNSSASRSSNYRGIAIEPVISRIFEALYEARNKDRFRTNAHQYAYKTGESCSSCAYTLLEVVEYYAKRNSSVQLLFLDVRKAFDKLVPSILCSKLLDRSVPAAEVKLLHQILTSSSGVVKYDRVFSSPFKLEAGVRQGSLLRGLLWTIYVDALISDLQQGCHIEGCGIAAVFFADDICLISATNAGLRTLVEITEKFAVEQQVKGS